MIRIANTSFFLVAAAAAANAAVPASAADADLGKSVTVRHGDLNLTSENGVGALNRRIATAARSVCGGFHPADLPAKSRALACRTQAAADAAPKVEVAVAAARKGEMFAGTLGVRASNP